MRIKSALLSSLGLLAFAGLAAQPVLAQNNEPPPTGTTIDQLTGMSITESYQTLSPTFVASSADTNIAFAFREDPAFLELADVSLVDLTNPSGNLLVNGDFSLGPDGSSAPTGWQYLNTFGASFGGTVQPGCGPSGNNCYYDGAVQAYDGINQVVATTIGDTYELTFSFADDCAGSCGTAGDVTVYQPLSTNGEPGSSGNGRDMFVYAGASAPTRSVPEPGTLALFAGALAAMGFGLMRRRRAAGLSA